MRVGLINWSGHKNLGDDAMAQVLLDRIPNAVNFGEYPDRADWYILGGGTLISPGSLYYGIIPDPSHTIGVSLGVSSNWNGEGLEVLKKMHKIYVRDRFSFERLQAHGVESVLSVDLLTILKPNKKYKRDGIATNVLYTESGTHPDLTTEVDNVLKATLGCPKFALSPDEDKKAMPSAQLFESAPELIDFLSRFETVYATRLHANVLAWVSGCKDIRPIVYDNKVQHFYDRVNNMSQEEAQRIMEKDLKNIISIVTQI